MLTCWKELEKVWYSCNRSSSENSDSYFHIILSSDTGQRVQRFYIQINISVSSKPYTIKQKQCTIKIYIVFGSLSMLNILFPQAQSFCMWDWKVRRTVCVDSSSLSVLLHYCARHDSFSFSDLIDLAFVRLGPSFYCLILWQSTPFLMLLSPHSLCPCSLLQARGKALYE